ncbi:CTK2_1 [Sanghuangporus weigelae]
MPQERLRQQTSGSIEAVGLKAGFPRKTIATAQTLYHRFHLFFPWKDFNYYDVTMACLYVSTKMHDTLKKPHDILMVAYTVRFPELAALSKAMGGEVEIDPTTDEQDRQNLLGIERPILETVCFNFTVRMSFPYVIKIGRVLRASKSLTRFAWRLAVDSLLPQRKLHLDLTLELITLLGGHEEWEKTYKACVEDLEEICHLLLDLLIHAAQNPSATTSPSTPSSPSSHVPSPRTPHPHHSHPHPHPHAQQQQSFPPPAPYKQDWLMRLKIHLREREHPPRPRDATSWGSRISGDHGAFGSWAGVEDVLNRSGAIDTEGLGKNEGTVRFMFRPEGFIGAS